VEQLVSMFSQVVRAEQIVRKVVVKRRKKKRIRAISMMEVSVYH